MRPGEENLTVAITARVSKTDYMEFNRLFPQYGATTWFVRNALSEFLDRVREFPSMRDQINVAIEKMLDDKVDETTDTGGREGA